MDYYLISGHSDILKHTRTFTLPNNVYLLPLAQCGKPGKPAHDKIYSKIFNNANYVKRFVKNHPAGIFSPGNEVQNVFISAKQSNNPLNKYVHGVLKLPLPKGANLTNKTKEANYKFQPLSVPFNSRFQGKIKLSNMVKNRPGVYIGDYCRLAQNINYKPKNNKIILKNKTVNLSEHLKNNIPHNNKFTSNLKRLRHALISHAGNYSTRHLLTALQLELQRKKGGVLPTKIEVRTFLNKLMRNKENSTNKNK
jgi:hypothetical protein